MAEMNEKSYSRLERRRTVGASLISILIGLVTGSLLILIVGLTTKNIGLSGAWEGIRLVFGGLFSTGRDMATGVLTFGFNPNTFGNMLFRSTPLILTGLAVAVAFRTGLFNIGAPGQYLMGICVALLISLSIPSSQVSPVIIWFLAFLGGMLAGGLWGAISGALKAFLNINEVIACIMTNWIAANLVTLIFSGSNLRNLTENTKSAYIYKTSVNNVATAKLGLDKIFSDSQVNGGILIAILLAILISVLLNRTVFGFELRATGSNRYAARYAGIVDKRSIVLSMVIAGAMAGAAGALYGLSGNTEFYWSTYQSLPGVGFNGIPVALLASNSPIAVIFTGMFMAMLDISGQQLKNLTGYNEYLTNIIISVIVYLSAFSLVIRNFLVKHDDGVSRALSSLGNSLRGNKRKGAGK